MDSRKICEKIVVSESDIDEIVKRLGNQINTDYAGEEIVLRINTERLILCLQQTCSNR